MEVPRFARTLAARGIAPGPSPAAVEAARAFEQLADLLVGAAPREMLLRRLGDALAQTSRQVNSLEHHLTPELRRQLVAVGRTLDEREREEHVRLGLLARRKRAP
jgi:vacuolar-type H+-ATPase subunit D/Vma8